MTAPAISPELAALLAAYATAINDNDKAWAECTRIDDLPEMENRPWPKVQVARLLKSRDDDGNDIYEPIYAYDVEGIEKHTKHHLDVALVMQGGGPESEARREKVRKNFAERIARWTDELARLKSARKAIEDAAGYTAAVEAAKARAADVKEIEAKILEFVPASLMDAAQIAAWTIKGMSDDAAGFLDDDAPLKVLASFGKAVTK